MVARERVSSLRDGRAKPRVRRSTARASRAHDGVRGQLSDLQRSRIISATFDVCSERGAANVTVAHVVERSGVSRRTFYDLFNDREDCLLAAFEQALEYARERVIPAYDSVRGWREGTRAGLVALLRFLDEEPTIGRILIVESLSGGPLTSSRRAEVLGSLLEAVERERAKTKAAGATIPPLTGEGLLGGVLTVLYSRLVEDDRAPLVELTNPLMSMIVLPYLGAAAARRELERPVPKPVSGQGHAALGTDPFKEAGMRLTYRTVRVLVAIGDMGERGITPSNRAVGDAAEMSDQGQISKVLARLVRAGLIANTKPMPGKGAPNSWTLTSSGRQVVSTIKARTEGYAAERHKR